MIRGTTANFRFKLPYDLQQVKKVTISFWQTNNAGTIDAPLPIIKTLESCATTDNPRELSVTLNPHETSRFSCDRKARVQLDGETVDAIVFGNKPQMFNVYPHENGLPEVPGTPVTGDGYIVLDGGSIVG